MPEQVLQVAAHVWQTIFESSKRFESVHGKQSPVDVDMWKRFGEQAEHSVLEVQETQPAGQYRHYPPDMYRLPSHRSHYPF